MMVVLPAPLGPRRPMISPASMEKLTPLRAWTGPYDLCRLRTLIIVFLPISVLN